MVTIIISVMMSIISLLSDLMNEPGALSVSITRTVKDGVRSGLRAGVATTLCSVRSRWPFVFGSVMFNASMVILLTWVVMPLITRALHGWLHAETRRTAPR